MKKKLGLSPEVNLPPAFLAHLMFGANHVFQTSLVMLKERSDWNIFSSASFALVRVPIEQFRLTIPGPIEGLTLPHRMPIKG